MIDRKKLINYLKKEGFKEEDEDIYFQKGSVSVYIDCDCEKTLTITFANSVSGWFKIEEPSFKQIKNVVSVFNDSQFCEIEEADIYENCSSTILKDIENFLNSKKLKNSKLKNKNQR